MNWKRPKTPARVTWVDPPPAARGPSAYDETVPDRLRAKPGKWALIKTANYSNSAGSYAKNRRERWGDAFEIAVRGKDVYARFVGDPGSKVAENIAAADRRKSD